MIVRHCRFIEEGRDTHTRTDIGRDGVVPYRKRLDESYRPDMREHVDISRTGDEFRDQTNGTQTETVKTFWLKTCT